MTVGLYARRKQWPLENITVSLRHSRIHAKDCEECETKEGMLDRIETEIELIGSLSSEQRAKLMEIAAKCPVHRNAQSGDQHPACALLRNHPLRECVVAVIDHSAGGCARQRSAGSNDPATTIGRQTRFLKGRSAVLERAKDELRTCLTAHKRRAQRGGKPRNYLEVPRQCHFWPGAFTPTRTTRASSDPRGATPGTLPDARFPRAILRLSTSCAARASEEESAGVDQIGFAVTRRWK